MFTSFLMLGCSSKTEFPEIVILNGLEEEYITAKSMVYHLYAIDLKEDQLLSDSIFNPIKFDIDLDTINFDSAFGSYRFYFDMLGQFGQRGFLENRLREYHSVWISDMDPKRVTYFGFDDYVVFEVDEELRLTNEECCVMYSKIQDSVSEWIVENFIKQNCL